MNSTDRKYARLKKIIESYGSLLVAYSGGVDSTLLLKVASDILGGKVVAVTAVSAAYPRTELVGAKKTARLIGVRHRVFAADELRNENFIRNAPDRCYWCRLSLIKTLKRVAAREGLKYVAFASHRSDADDYRPGERAIREQCAVTPLADAGFTKRDVRILSRRLDIPGWNREAAACLASRIPYGERIDRNTLRRVEAAEEFIRSRGFDHVRVRCHGDLARIEVRRGQIGKLGGMRAREDISSRLGRMGFNFVTVDLDGYRTGSLNIGIRGRVRKTLAGNRGSHR